MASNIPDAHKPSMPRRRAAGIFAVVAMVWLDGRGTNAQHADYGAKGTHRPLALHQLVVVPPAGDAVVALRGYDTDGDLMKATVVSLPEGNGVVYQLSKVLHCQLGWWGTPTMMLVVFSPIS